MQLVSNTKVNLSQPPSLQLDCNQGNHSVVKTTLIIAGLYNYYVSKQFYNLETSILDTV